MVNTGKPVEWLRERLPHAELITGDAHALGRVLGKRKFDLIIAADVIEHLPSPGVFLTSCRGQMSEDGELLITTVNTYSIIRIAKALLFHEAVHPDHTAYYSHKTLDALLYRPVEANEMIRRSYDSRPYDGGAVLFRVEHHAWSHPDTRNEWHSLVRGGLEVRPIPGHHYQTVKEPHV